MMASTNRRSLLLGTLSCAAFAGSARAQRKADVQYVPTPPAVVAGMLDLAALKAGDRLIDLGSGDGRIPIAAARRGAVALGVEIDGDLVARARALARLEGLEGNPRFVRDDLFTVSLREADVVTLYLLPELNERLKPKLLAEMKPGARVVSHAFDMGDWPPAVHREVADRQVYLWIIPAIAGGDWVLIRDDGSRGRLTVEQRYSRVTGMLDGVALTSARLDGASLEFTAGGVAYRGIVGDRTIVAEAGRGWRAERVE
ncbi:methyltransferase domain-containing protein [Sphingomonas sp. LT1P40]|uniref:methyltransferase domain-containing protein n=1 Tax=Alteristakelama amylovorans TaxID=3096166 RepID=UPI002FC77968